VAAIALFGAAGTPASAASTAWLPVYASNFPDPTVLNNGGSYYGFATQTGKENIDQAVSADGIHWSASTVNAMPNLPSWGEDGAFVLGAGTNWAPSVAYNPTTKQFVMFTAVLDKKYSPAKHCISKAVSSTPAGPYVDSSSTPFLCQPAQGGTIDPDIYIDSRTGNAYLYVKNAGNAAGVPDHLWVQGLTASFTPAGSLKELLSIDQGWQGRTIEGPSMAVINGKYFLFYAGNSYASSKYAIGYATCSSAMGPCTDNPKNPLITSSGSMLGPGSPSFYTNEGGQQKMVFGAWYKTVGSIRAMYQASLALSNGQIVVTAQQ
jgi:beta-xylosidase